MSWIDIAWPMMAAASLTVGLIHLLIWLRRKSRYEYLAFFVLAVSVVGFAAGEWLLMRANEPRWYGEVFRWMHVVIFIGEVSRRPFRESSVTGTSALITTRADFCTIWPTVAYTRASAFVSDWSRIFERRA